MELFFHRFDELVDKNQYPLDNKPVTEEDHQSLLPMLFENSDQLLLNLPDPKLQAFFDYCSPSTSSSNSYRPLTFLYHSKIAEITTLAEA